MSRFPSPIERRRDGAALIVTLALMTIASIILISFVSSTRLDRAATASFGKSMQAEQIAQGALSLVTGSLQQEMTKDAPPATFGGVTVCTNVTTANLLPQRAGVGTGMTNVVKVSTTAPFFTNAVGGLVSSGIGSTTATGATRGVSLARWNRPGFYTFTDAATAPSWVYVTRNGPTNGAGLAFGSSGNTANNAAPGNTNFALGRFAYAIYDEGGLIDLTAAGYPSTGSDLTAAGISHKGPQALAELTEIPGLARQADVDALVAWRNKASLAGSYTNYIYTAGATNGFLTVAAGDNTFLSRGDLIAYAQSNGIAAALPYLTTFSRERNSPSIPAGANPALNPDFRTLVYNGKPLQRFPLGRFNLLNQDPTQLSATDKANISAWFGLVPSAGASATWRSWQYRAATIGTPQAAIASGRAPDAFELVKAAIANGSLGSSLKDNAAIRSSTSSSGTATPYPPEQNADEQVARIVANMIDQCGTDNYPTTIQMGSGAAAHSVYGIKSLPYFSEFFLKEYYPSLALTDATGAQIYLYFELWNPHRGAIPAVGPAKVQIVVNPQARYDFYYTYTPTGLPATYCEVYTGSPTYSKDNLQPFPSYAIGIGNLANYQEPSIVMNPADAASYQSGLATGFNGFRLNPPVKNMPASMIAASGSRNFIEFQNYTTTFSLQYWDGGAWRTYSTFAGYDNDAGATGFQDTGVGEEAIPAPPGNASYSTFNNKVGNPCLGMPKPDPRTFRFRAGWWRSLPTVPFFNGAMVGGADPGEAWDQSYPSDFPTPYYGGMLYRNNGSGNPIVKDPDGAGRVGDGFLSSATSPANPMQTASPARPVILNRPFASVGELGYVFRDMPWKSLNFFSADSGDANLLDLFCLEDAPLTAAKVSLNTPCAAVLKALLKGAVRDDAGGTTLGEADAAQIAGDILAMTQASPLLNRAALVNTLTNAAVSATYPAIKTQREASIRALASATQTRTWNLMIDLVAQSGRFTPTATGLGQFTVEGERRYWLHLAIDRFTCEVIESRLEPVTE